MARVLTIGTLPPPRPHFSTFSGRGRRVSRYAYKTLTTDTVSGSPSPRWAGWPPSSPTRP